MRTECKRRGRGYVHKLFEMELKLQYSLIKSFIYFLAHLAIGHVSYCHHLASEIVINNFSKIFFSETTRPIRTELGTIPWGILHWSDAGSSYPLKNMWLLPKIEHMDQTKVFHKYLQNCIV